MNPAATCHPGPGHPALDVRAAIAKLTPKHQQIIVEMYYHGRQVDDIARTLGIPEGTVKSRAYYALRHLKRLMTTPYTTTSPHPTPLHA